MHIRQHHHYIQHLGYIFTFLAISIRDVLWLRCILATAQSLLFVYAIYAGRGDVALWNTIFLIVNIYYVVRIYNERKPVDIPESVYDIYDNIFSHFSSREFMNFWKLGSDLDCSSNMNIISDGASQDSLYIILDGTAIVKKNEYEIAKLNRGSFIAEMSLLTSRPANADVIVGGELKYRSWNKDVLLLIKNKNPDIWIKIQYTLTRDLATKIETMNKVSMQNKENTKLDLIGAS